MNVGGILAIAGRVELMFRSIRFRPDIYRVCWPLEESEIETEAVCGKILVGVEGGCAVDRIDGPYAAVVVEREVQIKAISSGQVQNGDGVERALTARNRGRFRG